MFALWIKVLFHLRSAEAINPRFDYSIEMSIPMDIKHKYFLVFYKLNKLLSLGRFTFTMGFVLSRADLGISGRRVVIETKGTKKGDFFQWVALKYEQYNITR